MRGWLSLFIGLFLVIHSNASAGQLIPADRTYGEAWQGSGYPGEIPAPVKIVNVRDYGAVGNGIANDQPAIVAAMAALSNAPGVIYFPAGQYLTAGITKLNQGTVLRGERPGNTSLVISNDPILYPFYITTNQASPTLQSVVSGYTNHSSVITVTDGSIFAAGGYAEIVESNDSAWGVPASSWNESVGQILQISSVAGNTLTLVKPLRLNYSASLSPSIRKITVIKDVGIENLGFRRVITTVGTGSFGNRFDIDFTYAANCWVRGIISTNCLGASVAVERSTHVEVTGCYIHSPIAIGGGGQGYGIKLQFHPGECKFENNIFRKLRHSMALQAGANGNVFAYNYSREQIRTETPTSAAGDIQLHGSWTHANLFEGNIIQYIQADNNSGANGPFNTFFRNRAEYAGIDITEAGSTNLNVVGNETAAISWSFPYSLVYGDGYRLQGSGNFQYANNTQSDGIQAAGTTNLTDYSYYLTNDPSILPATPGFWNITNTFPTVGLPLAYASTKYIPASTRYLLGAPSLAVGPPSLASQPTNFTANAGSTAFFSVQATGTPVAVFAWYKDGVALPGQTNATATLVNAQPSDAGSYNCLITDGNPFSVRSASVTLTIIGGPTCTYGLGSSSTNVAINGGTGYTFNVTASDSGCAWTTTDDVAWITNVTPASSSGNGSVSYDVLANASGLIRTGHVIAAGLTFTVTQDACGFSLPISSTNIVVDGVSTASFTVTSTGTACTWTTSVDVVWINNLSPVSTNGSASVSYTVAGNSSGSTRTGHITAAGQTYTVTQDTCGFSLPGGNNATIAPNGTNLTSLLLSANGTSCTWSASADVSWITSLSPTSGSGDSNINYGVLFNPNATSRTGHITAAGLTYTVNQDGAVSSSNDGVPDWWRVTFFGSSSTNSQTCATCDYNGTGQNNLFKYVAGLDPTNPSSVFTLTIATVPGQPLQRSLQFNPVAPGRTYTAMFKTNLTLLSWTPLPSFSGPSTNVNQVTITDLNAAETNKFYDINISLP